MLLNSWVASFLFCSIELLRSFFSFSERVSSMILMPNTLRFSFFSSERFASLASTILTLVSSLHLYFFRASRASFRIPSKRSRPAGVCLAKFDMSLIAGLYMSRKKVPSVCAVASAESADQ